jgi:hypothetical protein
MSDTVLKLENSDRALAAIWVVAQGSNMLAVTAVAVLGRTFLLSRTVVVAVPGCVSVVDDLPFTAKTYFLTTLSIASRPIFRTSILGP